MSRLLRSLVLLAVAGAAGGALAYVRTTTSGNPATGTPVYWKDARAAYRVNASAFASQPGCADAAAAARIVRASIATWTTATREGESQPCTGFRFVDDGDTTATALGKDGTNLVVFRRGLCSAVSDPICQSPPGGDYGPCIEKYSCWSHDANTGGGGIVALTTMNFLDSGQFTDVDLELNGWNGAYGSQGSGFYFTCADPPAPACTGNGYGQAGCIGYDLASTVTHEAGHMLGLDHVCVTSYPPPYNACPNYGTATSPIRPTMAPTTAIGATTKRTLWPDDIDGVCAIYPVGGSSGGCASGGGGVLALAALAAARALAWRRRASRQDSKIR